MAPIAEDQSTSADAELSPALREKIKWFMDQMLQTFTKSTGEPVNRVLYYKGNVDITDLTPGDTGVYQCVAQWGSGQSKRNVTLGVYSVQVTADTPTRYVFAGESMKFVCHSETLGRLFPAATRHWLYNGSVVKVPAQAPANSRRSDVISHVTKSMSGIWECQVVHSESNRVWNTAWLKLGIQDPPSIFAKLYTVLVDHSTVVIVVISIVVVMFLVLFVLACFKMNTKEDETEQDFLKQRTGWEKTLSKLEHNGRINVDTLIENIEKSESTELGAGDGEFKGRGIDEDYESDGEMKKKKEKGDDEKTGGSETESDTSDADESSGDSDDDDSGDETTIDDDDDDDDVDDSDDDGDDDDDHKDAESYHENGRDRHAGQKVKRVRFAIDEYDEVSQKSISQNGSGNRSSANINKSSISGNEDKQDNKKDSNGKKTLKATSRQKKSEIRVSRGKLNKSVHLLSTQKLDKTDAYKWLLQKSQYLRYLDAQLPVKNISPVKKHDIPPTSFQLYDHTHCDTSKMHEMSAMTCLSVHRAAPRNKSQQLETHYQPRVELRDNYSFKFSDAFPDNSLSNTFIDAYEMVPSDTAMSPYGSENVTLIPPVNFMQANQLNTLDRNPFEKHSSTDPTLKKNRRVLDNTVKTSRKSRLGRSMQSLKSWFAEKILIVGRLFARPSESSGWQHCDVRYSVLPQADIAEDDTKYEHPACQ